MRYIDRSVSEGDTLSFESVERSDVDPNGRLAAVLSGDDTEHVVLTERVSDGKELPSDAIVLGVSNGRSMAADSLYYAIPREEYQ